MSLICENCGHLPQNKPCGECRHHIPIWAVYCPYCGIKAEGDAPAAEGGDPFAIENRRLCPDGNCIGILDEKGRCVVCGQAG